MYATASAWKDAEKSTVTNAWHTLWPATLFGEYELTSEFFKGFRVPNSCEGEYFTTNSAVGRKT